MEFSPENKNHTHYYPVAALLVVQALFGSSPVVAKFVLASIPAVSLVGFRVGITALILIFVQASRRRLWLKDRGDYVQLAVLSLFGITFNQLLFIGGLSLTKAANTSLLAVTIPIFTIVIGAVIGTERLRIIRLIGIVLAIAGVIILIDPSKASFSSETTLGDFMIILNSLSFGIYVAISKEIITRNGAFRSMMWIFIFASVICVPLGLITLSSIDIAAITPLTWYLVVYVAIFSTAVPYLLNAYAIAKVSASTVAAFIYLQPLIGFTFAAIFLGETIDQKFAIAVVFVFVGLFLVSRRNRADFAN